MCSPGGAARHIQESPLRLPSLQVGRLGLMGVAQVCIGWKKTSAPCPWDSARSPDTPGEETHAQHEWESCSSSWPVQPRIAVQQAGTLVSSARYQDTHGWDFGLCGVHQLLAAACERAWPGVTGHDRAAGGQRGRTCAMGVRQAQQMTALWCK